MRSMTGFGQSSISTDVAEVEAQIKTVNGRYLDIKSRLPRDLLGIESLLHKVLRARLHRGRIELRVEIRRREAGTAHVNLGQVESYLKASRELAEAGVQGELTLDTLLTLPHIFDSRTRQENHPQAIITAVEESLDKALDQVVRHRETEGLSLKNDLLDRLSIVSGLTDEIEESSKSIFNYQRQRLQERIAALENLADF